MMRHKSDWLVYDDSVGDKTAGSTQSVKTVRDLDTMLKKPGLTVVMAIVSRHG